MLDRRLRGALLAAILAAPLIAAAPRGTRVLARAEAASPAPSPSPSPSSSPAPHDPARTAKARAEYEAWRAGTVDLTHYVAQGREQIAAEPQTHETLDALGKLKRFAFVRTLAAGGQTVDVYRAEAAHGALEELIGWNAEGRIHTIVFRAPQS